MKIGNYMVADEWKHSQSGNFSYKNIKIYEYINSLLVLKITPNDLWQIDIPYEFIRDAHYNIYKTNIHNLKFKSETEATNYVDVFLDKLSRLKCFL